MNGLKKKVNLWVNKDRAFRFAPKPVCYPNRYIKKGKKRISYPGK